MKSTGRKYDSVESMVEATISDETLKGDILRELTQQEEPYTPKPGDICYCQHGHLGMITHGPCILPPHRWHGIHLVGEKIGKPWQSTKPVCVGNITDVLDILQPSIADDIDVL